MVEDLLLSWLVVVETSVWTWAQHLYWAAGVLVPFGYLVAQQGALELASLNLSVDVQFGGVEAAGIMHGDWHLLSAWDRSLFNSFSA